MGYQFADFAVQMQNGTSFLQAFGQQGSQLLAVFGPLGAVMGAVVAIGAALGTVFSKAGAATGELKEQLSSFNKELEILRSGASSEEEMKLRKGIAEQDRIILKLNEALVNEGEKRGESLRQAIADQGIIRDELEGQLDTLLFMQRTQGNRLTNLQIEKLALDAITEAEKEASKNALERMIKSHDMLSKVYADQQKEEQRLATLRDNNFKTNKGNLETQLQLIRDEVNLRKMHTDEAYIQEILEQNKVRVLAEAKGLTGAQVDELVRLTIQLQTQKGDLEDILELERSRAFFAKEIADRQKEAHDALAASFGKGEDEKKSPVGRAKALAKVMKTELSPAAQRLVDISNSIGSSFENAMMSAVRGTMSVKDAFRTMAADIIAELYRVFVVKQITGFISQSIQGMFGVSQLDQGISLRPRARPRAAGGPVSAGSPYLVGERGPELIVPNRNGTVIPNNQLGGGGVVVNQVINVTTGVQQTVRAEIRQLMPQIADSAKAAVLDAKRRGGSYGRAFA